MEIERLAKFPMQDEDDWIMTVIIGGVLVFLGFLFVPVLAVWGYVVQVVRGAVAGETEPPQFDDWGSLVVDGLKGFVVVTVYQMPAVVVGGGVFLLFALLGVGTDSGGLGFLGFLLGFLVWTVLSMVFGYLGMAGFVNFAVEDSIGAAFDVGTIVSLATSGAWVKAFLFYMGISIVGNLLAGFTGGLAAPFVGFYALSAGGRAFGEAFADVTGAGGAATQSGSAPEATATR